MTDDSVRKSATDAEIDAALASLTDVSPSPALGTNVMRRVAHEKSRSRRSGVGKAEVRWAPGWRVALAAAGVLVIAAATSWFALKRAPVDQIATSVHGDSVPRVSQSKSGGEQRSATPTPGPIERPLRSRPTPRASFTTRVSALPASPIDTAASVESPSDPTAAIPPIAMAPLTDPAPVTMTPVSIPPIEIPEIEIRPIDEPPNSAVGPARQDPNKNPAGAVVRGLPTNQEN